MIIKATDTTYIKLDEATKRTEFIDLTELEADKTRFEARIAEIEDKTDKELLAWAKENYPTPEQRVELEENKRLLAEIEDKIDEIAKLK